MARIPGLHSEKRRKARNKAQLIFLRALPGPIKALLMFLQKKIREDPWIPFRGGEEEEGLPMRAQYWGIYI